MSDVILPPGAARDSEEVLVLIAPYENAMSALLRWRNETHGNRRHRPAPFGWCSWYDRYENIDSDHIAGVIAAADTLKNRLPFDFIQIDMGYETLWGDWRPHPAKFPDGLSRHVKAIRDSSARPGIWFALLAAHDSLGLLESHPDWFQQNAQREREDGGDGGHYLDPTHPEVKERLRAILCQARADGFTYFKCDYNMIRGRMHDATKTRLQAYRDFYALIRESIGEDAYLLACSGYERGVLGFADAARTGIDSVPVWRDPNTVLCLTCVYPTILANAVTNGTFGVNDPDVTYSGPTIDRRTGKSINQDEWRVWHGIVGLLGGLTAISEPLSELTEGRIRALEILRPPVAERGRCFGAAVGDWTQFGFVARRAFGDFATLLLWNPEDGVADISLNPDGLFAKQERFHVWSFWDGAYRGVQDADFVAKNLPPHGGLHLRLTPVSLDDLPVLIGSNLHIGCGAAEIADFAATPRGVTITLNDGGAREGNLYLHSDAPLRFTSAERCVVTGVAEVALSVWKVTLSGRRWGVPQLIHLEATL